MHIIEQPSFIDPRYWGSALWSSMDAVAVVFDATLQDSKDYTIIFFMSLRGVIPCGMCREHYNEYCTKYPIEDHIESRKTLLKWIHRLKNQVSLRLGRPKTQFQEYIRSIEDKFHISLITR